MNKNHNLLLLILAICVVLSFLMSCAGTIKTTKYYVPEITVQKKAYIIASKNSQYIRFRPGIFVPMGTYIVLPDKPSIPHEVIGNTDTIIKNELRKYGINAEITSRGDTIGDFDFLIEYHDTGRWDFKKILDKLEIVFIAPDGKVISKSEFNIHKNKEFHNFPTPEKEVPKMIKELFEK